MFHFILKGKLFVLFLFVYKYLLKYDTFPVGLDLGFN